MRAFALTGLYLIAILLVAGCAGISGSKRVPDELLGAQRLSQEDLRYIQENLYEGNTKYIYRVYSRSTEEEEFSVFRAGEFEGALVMGHPSSRIPLFDGTTTDNRFNRIATRSLVVNGRSFGWGQRSSMPDGSLLNALSRDAANGRVSFAVILTPAEQLVLILGEEIVNTLPCIHAAAIAGEIDAMADCAAEAGGGGAGGSAGGVFHGAIDLIGEPDCKEGALGRISTQGSLGRRASRNGARRVQEITERMDAIRDYRDGELSGNAEGRRIYGDLSNALANERRANQDLADAEARLQRAYDRADRAGLADRRDAQREVRRAQNQVTSKESGVQRAEASREERERDAARFERDRQRSGGGNSGGGSPVFGEEPATEDPRCEGRRVDEARGTLFTNDDFCQGDDPLTCLRRQQDSLYGLTEGQCWTETGPDDAQQITCGKSERFGSGETLPARPPPQDGSCPEGNLGCWTDPVAPRTANGKIHLRYVDVMPIGGILIGLCAAGGCEQILNRGTP